MSLGLLVYCPNLSLSWSVGSVQIFLSKSQRSKLPTIKPGTEENIQQHQDWWRRKVSIKMQDCEPSGTFSASLKHLQVIWTSISSRFYCELQELWNMSWSALLPLGTLALERAWSLKVFIYLRLQSTSSSIGQDWGASTLGTEPCINFKVVYLSLSINVWTIKSRCPVCLT